ncbi:MAG: hypothetical protein GX059_07520 [Clostridiales bacterium]|nr:hypothetical protein [Clostridiales bacterium]
MNIKIKKSVVITILYCMCFGAMTTFIGALYPEKDNNDAIETSAKIGSLPSSDPAGSSNRDMASNETTGKDGSGPQEASPAPSASPIPSPSPSPTPEPTPTPEPSPTPLPVYEVEYDGYPEIEKFFYDYYVAWISCDLDLLKTITTDPGRLPSLASMEKETMFIDDIRNFEYYFIKSYEENAYIVYVYYEIKYVNIKTPLPRMDKFYLISDSGGKLKIYNSEMDDVLKQYYDERDQDQAIQEVINTTNVMARQALDKDEALRVYIQALYGY